MYNLVENSRRTKIEIKKLQVEKFKNEELDFYRILT